MISYGLLTAGAHFLATTRLRFDDDCLQILEVPSCFRHFLPFRLCRTSSLDLDKISRVLY